MIDLILKSSESQFCHQNKNDSFTLKATSAIGERSKLQADLESTQAALKSKGNAKVQYIMDLITHLQDVIFEEQDWSNSLIASHCSG